ncbi:MAG: ribonuclease J [bacterium]
MKRSKDEIAIVPLGGLGEIGKNMIAIGYGDDIVVVDAGMAFPDEEMLGIDLVLPDITYLLENRGKVRGIVLTHGHEDHVGALPYILPRLRVPIYGTKLTLGLVESRLEEFELDFRPKFIVIAPRQTIELGKLRVEFIRVTHSIVDGVAVVVHTPLGTVLHTGDFKVDHTPVDGEVMDLQRLAELGEEGILVLMSDSTNVEREGPSLSEREVGNYLDDIVRGSDARIIVATFASNIHRIQQVIDVAHRYGRKVAIVGMSMERNIRIASELGYMRIPPNTLVDIDKMKKIPKGKAMIVTTGTQGEPMSALARMAMGTHREVRIRRGDVVAISARTIPGNERSIASTINHLYRLGARVIYERVSEVHVSGHASQEDLKLMLNLVKPRYLIPIHGEYRHLVQHADLAASMGIPRERIFVVENGTVLRFDRKGGRIAETVPSGRVFVDGKGIGDVGAVVLRDRQHLAQDGLVIVVVTLDGQTGEILSGPEIISRGFVYVKESEDLMAEAREIVRSVMVECEREKNTEWSAIKSSVRGALSQFLYDKTHRRPMILPLLMEV